MNRKKIAALRRQLAQLRTRSRDLKERELVRFARKVGRYRDTSRGKEPTYVTDLFPGARPISIPSHGTIKVGVAGNILDSLEEDIDRLSEMLGSEE